MLNCFTVRNHNLAGLFMVFLGASTCGFAQVSEQEKILEIELQRAAAKQRFLTLQLDSAILLSEQEAFGAADEKFKFVLKNLKSIPSDFTYHFGKNSFFLGKYRQSIDWLNKYIQLKGTSGQFSEEAVDWLGQAEAELLKERDIQSKKAGEVLSRDYEIDCGPSGKVVCPVCSGKTVVIKKGYYSDSYKTCPFCNKVGFLSCEDYNKLVRGQLKPVGN